MTCRCTVPPGDPKDSMTQDNPDQPDQPDGIDPDSLDLPDPHNAARRVRDFLEAYGDGEIETVWSEGYLARPGVEQRPLYARDLEALSRLPEFLAAQREQVEKARESRDQFRTVANEAYASEVQRRESAERERDEARAEVARLCAQSDTGQDFKHLSRPVSSPADDTEETT